MNKVEQARMDALEAEVASLSVRVVRLGSLEGSDIDHVTMERDALQLTIDEIRPELERYRTEEAGQVRVGGVAGQLDTNRERLRVDLANLLAPLSAEDRKQYPAAVWLANALADEPADVV